MQKSISNNINRFSIYFFFLVAIAKLIRFTILYDRLVLTGRGWGYIHYINLDCNSFGLNFITNSNSARGSVAVNNVMALCESINIFGIESYYGWEVFITLVFNFILYHLVIVFYKRNPHVSKVENYFIYFNVIILNIFCFCLAKEFFQMIFWIVTMIAIKDVKNFKQGYIRVAIALFITILFTRKYYGLVFIYFVVVDYFIDRVFGNIDFKSKRSKFKIIGGVFSLFVVMSAMYFVMTSFLMLEAEDTYEELERVNSTDRGAAVGAASTITPIFSRGGDVYILTLEYFIKIFRLMFPVELLLRFKPTYVITIVFQGMLFYILVNNLIQRKQCSIEKKLATDLYIAFWLTSAAFEPDFGSWLRHQSVVLPVMLYMLGGNSVIFVTQENQRLYLKSC